MPEPAPTTIEDPLPSMPMMSPGAQVCEPAYLFPINDRWRLYCATSSHGIESGRTAGHKPRHRRWSWTPSMTLSEPNLFRPGDGWVASHNRLSFS